MAYRQEVENAFSLMARENVDAVIVGASSFFAQQRNQIAELVIKHRMPSMFGNAANVEAGGLMSYGYKVSDNYRRAATYVDRLFKRNQAICRWSNPRSSNLWST